MLASRNVYIPGPAGDLKACYRATLFPWTWVDAEIKAQEVHMSLIKMGTLCRT